MKKSNRQKQIIELVKMHNDITVSDLMERFNVSDMTIRRDLADLEKSGIIKRTLGGATYIQQNLAYNDKDIALSLRKDTEIKAKQMIAEKAASYIKEGDTLILDAGSTTLEIAKILQSKGNITVLTNALNIASTLSTNPDIQIILTGGDLRHSTLSIVGPASVEFIEKLRVDYSFIGCSGISLDRGLMNTNMVEGEVKRAMMKVANKVFVVADYTKFEQMSFNSFAQLPELDGIITNNQLHKEYVSAFSALEKPELIIV